MRLVVFTLVLGLSACRPDPAADTPPASPTTPEVDRVALARLLPDSLLGRARQSLDQSRDGALGAEIERVSARYREIDVSVTDFKTSDMTEMMGYGWALVPNSDQVMGHPGRTETAARSAGVQVVVGRRYLVEARATSQADALAVLNSLDLTALD